MTLFFSASPCLLGFGHGAESKKIILGAGVMGKQRAPGWKARHPSPVRSTSGISLSGKWGLGKWGQIYLGSGQGPIHCALRDLAQDRRLGAEPAAGLRSRSPYKMQLSGNSGTVEPKA